MSNFGYTKEDLKEKGLKKTLDDLIEEGKVDDAVYREKKKGEPVLTPGNEWFIETKEERVRKIVDRLNRNSFTIKGYSFALALLFASDVLFKADVHNLLAYFIFNFVLWCLDAQYLLSEWRVRAFSDPKIDKRMKRGKLSPFAKALFSKSLIVYYPLFSVGVLALYFLNK